MKTRTMIIFLWMMPTWLFAQMTKAEFATAIDSVKYSRYTLRIPESMSCDSIFDVFNTYNEYKGLSGKYNDPKSKELGRLTYLLTKDKIRFYEQLIGNDSCAYIRKQLINEFIYTLKYDSTDKDIFSEVLGFFQKYRNDKISEENNFRSLMLELMKRDDIVNSDYYSDWLISGFKLTEHLPRYWEIFNNIDESEGAFNKFSTLKDLSRLGDSLKAHQQYIDDMWKGAKSDEKVIDNEYLYLLLSKLKYNYTPYRREKVKELFKILKYLKENPQKNKRVFFRDDSESGRLYNDLDLQVYFSIIENVKLDKEQFNFKHSSTEKHCELLKWYKKHPDFELTKGR